MPVNYEIKSQLAKLLATEDIIVENREVQTAQFNVDTRVLTLPMWKRASNSVYDMLVGHEVGHALYTPNEDPPSHIPHGYINVTEDARIEKLMKRRYPGLHKSFYAGYKELSDQDFFCLEDSDVSEMTLADRVNLYFKIGNFVDISFTDEEIAIRDMIGDAETFADAVLAAEVLHNYCKGANAPEKVGDLPLPNNQQDAGSGLSVDTPQQQQQSETVDEESDEGEAGEQIEEQGEEEPDTYSDDGVSHSPEVTTDEIFNERTQEFNGNDMGQEIGYYDLPIIDLDNIVIRNEQVHDELNESWKQQSVPLEHDGKFYSSDYGHADSKYQEFKKSAQREVNYLVKEFECKKSADAYARAATSKTGVLDCSKLHTYKYNEDLFKKVTILPDGKNHGLIFMLDWSGSMAHEIVDTVKQVYNLVWFCSKVNIPFDLYAFTNSYHSCVRKELTEEDDGRFLVNDFNLLNLLTSGHNRKTLDEQMKSVWRLVYAMRYYVNYHIPPGYGLSGTPLNQSIACLYELIPQFKAKHDLQKVQCVILTDGEANVLPIVRQRTYADGEGYYHCYPAAINSYLRNRKNGCTYQIQYDYYKFTDILLTDLKKTFPDTNFIGFRLVDGRSMKYFVNKYEEHLTEKDIKIMKKDKFYAIKNSGYTSYFAMTTSALNSEIGLDVDEGATKAKIKAAFAKNLKAKALNKKVLSQFMDLVC